MKGRNEMEILEIMRQRHSVRQYENKPIEEEKRNVINDLIAKINDETGLNIQSCYDEPKTFDTFMAHYGKFEGVTNYIALIGKKGKDELIGYHGERIVLKAQELGLNTCWVAMTYGKSKAKVEKNKDEKIYCVLSLGYGKTQGVAHKGKSKDHILEIKGSVPKDIDQIVEACLLAPTAMNQQKFKIICDNENITIVKKGVGFYSNIDLGIVKCHYDLVANES